MGVERTSERLGAESAMSEATVDTMASLPVRAPFELALVVVTSACCVAAVAVSGAPAASAVTVGAMLPAAVVDIRTRRLPDRLVAPAAIVLVAGVGASSGLGQETSLGHLLIGLCVFAGPLLAIHLVAPAAMGFGDVKAASVLGAALGLAHPIVALAGLTAATATGGLAGLVMRQRTIAFGPALVVGAASALALVRTGTVT